MDDNRTGEKEMIRPSRIYDLLSKISDGTFLNDKEFKEIESYIRELELSLEECRNLFKASRLCSESTSPTQSEQP